MKKVFTLLALIITLSLHAQTIQYFQTGEEFSGPFGSWKNVKTEFGAKSDGVTNDAPAINSAILAMKISAADSFRVLFFPAGTYLQSGTVYVSVFDVFGKQVSEQKINALQGTNELNYLADGLNEGTYFLRFLSGAIIDTKKFIVIH